MIDTDSRLEALHVRYRASLPEKHANLCRAWQSLCNDTKDPHRFDIVMGLVHRLAGSATSYGYVELGQAAAEADALLDHLRDGTDGISRVVRSAGFFEQFTMRMQTLLEVLEQAAQKGPAI